MEEEDMISQLPDPILQHILSLIDIKLAVQTTILSSRWKNLCFSLSDLRFRLSRVAAHAGVSLKNRQSAQAFYQKFSLFVSHFLSHRDAATAVRNFHLSFDSRLVHVDAEFVEKCVSYSVDHGIQSLHLHAINRPSLRLPATFFSSKTLRELKLTQFGIYLPKDFNFPNLKTLYLEESMFIDDSENYSISKKPFSGFPELEKLTLRRSMKIGGIVISAPKLKFLEIIQDDCRPMEEISAPLLVLFIFEGNFPLDCSNINLPNLEEVYVNIYKKLGPRPSRWFSRKSVAMKCASMLQQLRNAKIVSLTLDTLEVLEMGGDVIEQCPSPFPYMKCLKLRRGRREIETVVKRVIDFLTEGCLYGDIMAVGVAVVERNHQELFQEETELQLQRLFEI